MIGPVGHIRFVPLNMFAVWVIYMESLQVLFTADLKAFATYGLVSPSPSPAVSPVKTEAAPFSDLPAPSPTPTKRKRGAQFVTSPLAASDQLAEDQLDLVSRVKSRKRLRSSTVVKEEQD